MCVSCLRYIADYTKATTVNDSMISFSSSSVACKFKELFVKLASSREAHCKYAHNQIVANRTRNFNPCPAVCFAFLCLDAKNNWANLTACSVLSALCWLRIDSPVADSLQTVINADDDKRTQERQREEKERTGNDCLACFVRSVGLSSDWHFRNNQQHCIDNTRHGAREARERERTQHELEKGPRCVARCSI